MIRVRFEPLGRELTVNAGERILDVTDDHPQLGIPFSCRAANCGICRVRIESGADAVEEPRARERELLQRLGSAPTVRLGCQLRIKRDPESNTKLVLHVLAAR